MKGSDRRHFLVSLAALGAGAALRPRDAAAALNRAAGGASMIAVASGNGLGATAKAMELLRGGADALDAVIAGVNLVEDDPKDETVGLGGLPNEDGIVELDACVMHGPTGRGAGVAALRNIRNPSKVARLVMERTDHVLIVGEGALRFARAHGFAEENLLTDSSRRKWLAWKEQLNREDDWLPPHDVDTQDIGGVMKRIDRPTGTINCLALDAKGNISGCTTTSGLAFKIPGRVGDSPILGAGLYVDNQVGAAGSTGRGEANLLACSSVIIVEHMRLGATPEEACLRACTRIADMTRMRRLKDASGRPSFNVRFYAIDIRGRSGSASIWGPGQYAVNTGEAVSRHAESAYLYKRPAK
ncbi:MAG: N(4)-(beta-N-acetylglucosaminyl)-L-asparaginase [Ignavibacteriae bacterium]|nr:N(4)-(beta-N-acetylglucosaminyl)-L-asparaginase [Ignavibacteriota bacterium]